MEERKVVRKHGGRLPLSGSTARRRDIIGLSIFREGEHRTVSQSIHSRLRPLLDAKMSRYCNWL